MKEKAVSLLEMKANKKLVQQALTQESGNVILLNNLSNLVSSMNKSSKNNLDAVVKMLKDIYGKLRIELSTYIMQDSYLRSYNRLVMCSPHQPSPVPVHVCALCPCMQPGGRGGVTGRAPFRS